MGNLCAKSSSSSPPKDASNSPSSPPPSSVSSSSSSLSDDTKSTTPLTSTSSPLKLNPKDFLQMNLKNATVLRPPGSLHSQQFVIDGCNNSQFYLFDNSAAITIDYCEDCEFFIGPCESSVFIRNSKRCTIVVACQQLRLRDCDSCHLNIFISASHPVIESSTNITFGCFSLNYFELLGQFTQAGLNPYNSDWGSVYDFSAKEKNGRENWKYDEGVITDESADTRHDSLKLLPKLLTCPEYLSTLGSSPFILHDSWSTPITYGKNRNTHISSSSILLKIPRPYAHDIIRKIQGDKDNNTICRQYYNTESKWDGEMRVMRSKVENSDKKTKEEEQIIGVEVNGDGCKEKVETIVGMEEKWKGTVKIVEKATEIEEFFRMMDM